MCGLHLALPSWHGEWYECHEAGILYWCVCVEMVFDSMSLSLLSHIHIHTYTFIDSQIVSRVMIGKLEQTLMRFIMIIIWDDGASILYTMLYTVWASCCSAIHNCVCLIMFVGCSCVCTPGKLSHSRALCYDTTRIHSRLNDLWSCSSPSNFFFVFVVVVVVAYHPSHYPLLHTFHWSVLLSSLLFYFIFAVWLTSIAILTRAECLDDANTTTDANVCVCVCVFAKRQGFASFVPSHPSPIVSNDEQLQKWTNDRKANQIGIGGQKSTFIITHCIHKWFVI